MLSRRTALLVAGATLAGCASWNNTNPTTLTPDDRAYSVAEQIIVGIKLSAATVIASGVVTPNTVDQINLSLTAIDNAMAAWHGSLNTSTSAELESAVFAILPTITSLLSHGKSNRAMMLRRNPA